MSSNIENYAATASALGFVMPSVGYIVGAVVFSIVGYIIYRLGRRTQNTYLAILGGVLMLFTYVVTDTFLVYSIGAGLCVAAWAAYASHEDD